jgi:hypothetical protein
MRLPPLRLPPLMRLPPLRLPPLMRLPLRFQRLRLSSL